MSHGKNAVGTPTGKKPKEWSRMNGMRPTKKDTGGIGGVYRRRLPVGVTRRRNQGKHEAAPIRGGKKNVEEVNRSLRRLTTLGRKTGVDATWSDAWKKKKEPGS